MFRTDINHWLQSFESTGLTYLMEAVSFIGDIYPVMIICLLVIGGIHLRNGWILLNIVAFTAFLTFCAKESIDFPRPHAVDPTLSAFGEQQTQINHTQDQPLNFLDLFPESLLAKTRTSEIGRYGFPSGHTSGQVAIWFGMVLIFKKRWLKLWAISFVILTMWSRMYLGMHYLGDVIGGLILGLVVTLVIQKLSTLAKPKNHSFYIGFNLLILIPWLVIDSSAGWQAALLLGANLAYWLHNWKYIYSLSGINYQRILHSILLIILFLGCFVSLKTITHDSLPWIENGAMILAGFIPLYVSMMIARRLNWINTSQY